MTATASIEDLLNLPEKAQRLLEQFVTGVTYSTRKGTKTVKRRSVEFTLGCDEVTMTIPSEIWDGLGKRTQRRLLTP